MCNNKFYTNEEKARIKLMEQYSVAILKGMSIKETAAEYDTCEEDILDILKEVKDINPGLFIQLNTELDGLFESSH